MMKTTAMLRKTSLFLLVLLLGSSNFQAVAQTSDPHKELRTLDSYFPFKPPAKLEDWQARRTELQKHLQVSLGLWPMPEKTPLKPVVHGKMEMTGYTIEKVYFESIPGFLVTGNLYRPVDAKGKSPGVLCPHGHWSQGRFMSNGDAEVKRQLDNKAEKFASNARSPLQARCATLARKGCVVFHYDMIGYADSRQIPQGLAHGFRKQRADMNDAKGWGLFSPQAELRSQSVMGLQTWNSIRSLDFLCSLPDVDPSRLGVTGASGGGTQTFILGALDPRPAVAFPAVMVSTAMQGGCTCENCCNLRIGHGNVEIAALFAPRPMGLTAANDWTKEMRTKGMPQLKSLYGLYNADDKVTLLSRTEFGHNYNRISRLAMYDWFNQHLALKNTDPETEIKFLGRDELTVFNGPHRAPKGGDAWEKKFLKDWAAISGKKIDLNGIQYLDDVERLRNIYTVALKSLINLMENPVRLKIKKSKKVYSQQATRVECEMYSEHHSLKSRVMAWESTKNQRPRTRCIYLFDEEFGKVGEGLTTDYRITAKAVNNKAIIYGMDLVKHTAKPNDQVVVNRLVDNGREAAGYTFGYNRTLFAWRVQQVYDLIRYLREVDSDCQIEIYSDPAMMPIALYVAAICDPDTIDKLVLHSDDFRFANIKNLRHAHFVPGVVKFGDIDGLAMMAVLNNTSIRIRGETLSALPHATRVSKLIGREPRDTDNGWESIDGKKILPPY